MAAPPPVIAPHHHVCCAGCEFVREDPPIGASETTRETRSPPQHTQPPGQELPFTTATTAKPMSSDKKMPPWDEQLFGDDENLLVRDSALCC